jgi:hypothetical protein
MQTNKTITRLFSLKQMLNQMLVRIKDIILKNQYPSHSLLKMKTEQYIVNCLMYIIALSQLNRHDMLENKLSTLILYK